MGPKTNSDSVQRGKANPAAATRWLLVVAAGLSVFMATLDMSVVAIALPAVERDLAIPTSLSEWVLLGYLLPLVALALPSGRWLDRVGTRAAFVTTAGGFAVTSVAAGLAPSAGVLVGARVIQGVFAAILLALVPVVATTAAAPEQRGKAMSIVATLGPSGRSADRLSAG